MNITIAILDDDEIYQKHLKNEINKYNETWIVSCFNDYEKMKNKDYDAYFIDIELGVNKNGFTTASQIKTQCPNVPILFISSHENYSLDGYHFNAFYFLSKSKMKNYLPDALHKLNEYFNMNDGDIELTNSLLKEKENVHYKDIVYFYSQGNYVYAETYDNHTYYTRTSIVKLNEQLPDNFFRIITGIIVNIDYIDNVNKSNYILYMKNKKKLKVSRLQYKVLIKKLQERSML